MEDIINKTERILDNEFIIHRYLHDTLFLESKFDITTKFFYLDLYKNNILIKLIISSYLNIDGIINWNTHERPILKTKYKIIKNIDELSLEERNICNYIIKETLKVCREKEYIKFDTDKDIRRQISLSFNRPWYKYPG